ncbi:MAG: 3-isopropylmalate dehydrogenase [Clostridiales bacterium]|uniref:3-isopropylmalate dehydrogenase n=1 Tax=Oscillospiraceae TaxID=216572 RepID=UPI0009A82A92|nr:MULTISPECIES: 3-isopropylmalate dehydrogenase [Oscillospiraceae]PWM38368.1 MAG: 3-isopropylmalate dehydrogenase [Clostridiales bacterium]RGB69785.1 3-isopropylmalate dehydrogenase [Harryflintia acetispora]
MDMKITVLKGDGIGPEIVDEAIKVLKVVCECENINLTLDEQLIGGVAIDKTGDPLPQETIDSCKSSDAVLLGAVGGPKWDALPTDKRPEKGLLRIRSELGLFANLRPARIFPELCSNSPLKDSIVQSGVDLLVVRELTGGIYFGKKGSEQINGEQSSYDEMRYSEHEIERIARAAFDAAAKRHRKVTCVDKANVLETSQLFRSVVARIGAKEYPDIELSNLYVDNASMQLVNNPGQFDVIVTGNLFGDILSDEAAMLTGSIGMLPSASLGGSGFGLYEPIHGSAPDIAGKGIANPLATILSVAMMLKHTFQMTMHAKVIEAAVEESLSVLRTPDLMPAEEEPAHSLGGYITEVFGTRTGLETATTGELGDFVANEVRRALEK